MLLHVQSLKFILIKFASPINILKVSTEFDNSLSPITKETFPKKLS